MSTVLPDRKTTAEELNAKQNEDAVPETTIKTLYNDIKSLSYKDENHIWAKDVRDALMAKRIVEHSKGNEGDMIMLVGMAHLPGLVKNIRQRGWNGDIDVKLSGALDGLGEIKTIQQGKVLEAEGIPYRYLDEYGVEYEGRSEAIASINADAKKKKESSDVSHDKLKMKENEGIDVDVTETIQKAAVEEIKSRKESEGSVKSEEEKSVGGSEIEDLQEILKRIRTNLDTGGPDNGKKQDKEHPNMYSLMPLPTFQLQRKLLERISNEAKVELQKNVHGSQRSNERGPNSQYQKY